ncbi:MAG: hypothetical protein M3P95_00195, partial [Actinomycetota bacterium]|nr:hypothetical protein [Actinomycetota bacterium]
AEALRAAVDDLPANTGARVVLVAGRTGGCAPGETCGAARELVDRGVGLRVDVVGVGPDAATLDELRCVSEATGGAVRVADTAPVLAETLTRTVLRALSPLARATVQQVRRDGEAPVTLPPGDHAEVLRPGESRRYDVGVVEGSEVVAAVSAVAPPELADRVVLRLSVGDGSRKDTSAVLLGLTRQSLRVRSATPAEESVVSPGAVAGPTAEPAATVPVVVTLEPFAAGGLPPSEVPVQVGVDVVDTLLVVESPEPVVQQLPPPPPERVVVHVDRVPTWVWWLVGTLACAVAVLTVALASVSLPARRRLDPDR